MRLLSVAAPIFRQSDQCGGLHSETQVQGALNPPTSSDVSAHQCSGNLPSVAPERVERHGVEGNKRANHRASWAGLGGRQMGGGEGGSGGRQEGRVRGIR